MRRQAMLEISGNAGIKPAAAAFKDIDYPIAGFRGWFILFMGSGHFLRSGVPVRGKAGAGFHRAPAEYYYTFFSR